MEAAAELLEWKCLTWDVAVKGHPGLPWHLVGTLRKEVREKTGSQ